MIVGNEGGLIYGSIGVRATALGIRAIHRHHLNAAAISERNYIFMPARLIEAFLEISRRFYAYHIIYFFL
jgi:hypothetical protein